ncbi:MAG: amino acid adenylation domain-containing protein, partial [bacterium]|nr:amino acid adenylation domain-containing protein [bacterium]
MDKKNRKKKIIEDYWLKKLSGDIPGLSLPLAGLETDSDAEDGAKKEELKLTIPAKITTRLKHISNNSDMALFILFFSALNMLLYKYTRVEDLLVATVTPRKPGSRERLLFCRNNLAPAMTFKECINKTRQVVTEAFDYGDYSFGALYRKLLDISGTDSLDLFHMAFIYTAIQKKTGALKQFDIVMLLIEKEGELSLKVEYESTLYSGAGLRRFCLNLIGIFSEFKEKLELPVSAVPVISPAELEEISGFNRTDSQFPSNQTLHGLFEARVERTPDHMAVKEGDRGLTYRELDRRSAGLAGILKAHSVGSDSIVPLVTENTVEMVICQTAVMKAGGAFLPIDPGYPEDRITYMLEDCNCTLLLTTGPLPPGIRFQGEIIEVNPEGGNLAKAPPYHADAGTSRHLAYVIYTSGTTGKPKGVAIQHNSIVNQLYGLTVRYDFDLSLHHILMAPITFDPSVQQIYLPLISGGLLHLVSHYTKNDPQELMNYLVSRQIGILNTVPSLISVLEKNWKQDYGFHLKYIILAGEVFSKELYLRLKRGVSVDTLINIYGPTEAAINTTLYRCREKEPYPFIPIGAPLMNYRLWIFDEAMNPQPIGVTGELGISGTGLARGYVNQPGLTAETFVPNTIPAGEPQKNHRQIYRTGDLVRWLPCGNIEFVGRIDHQVKIRGMRVELGEIENRLLKYKGVKEAVALARSNEDPEENKNKPKENLVLYAYILVQNPVDLEALKNYAEKFLPPYMVPTHIIPLKSFPLTQHGKVDLKALTHTVAVETVTPYAPPRDQLEEQLIALWAGELKIKKEKIGIKHNFFQLGGHSLKAGTLAIAIHKQLNVKIPLENLFNHPTLSEMADYIRGAGETRYRAVKPGEEREYYPLSPGQKRLFILHRADSNGIAYNMPSAVTLEGPVDSAKITAVIKQVIARHESLRTSFFLYGNEPVQRVHRPGDVPVEIETREPAANPTEEIDTFIRPFDLKKAPLLRAGLLKLEREKHVFIMDMHHIITDGASTAILFADFMEAYRGGTLTAPGIRYRDYTLWQNSGRQKMIREKQKKFWLKTFEKKAPPLNLPVDYARPALQSFAGRSFIFTIDPGILKGLKALALKKGNTLYMVLLSIYNIMISKIGGGED